MIRLSSAAAGILLLALGLVLSAAGAFADYRAHAQVAESGGHAGHEPVTGPPAHDAVVVGLGLAGIGAASIGLGALMRKDLGTRVGLAKYAALVLLIADGVLHLFVMNEHLSLAIFAAFFLGAGGVELGLPIVGVRRDRFVSWAGILVSAGLIAIYGYTRVLPPPFEEAPEPSEALGILSKVIEACVIALLGYVLLRRRALQRAPSASNARA